MQSESQAARWRDFLPSGIDLREPIPEDWGEDLVAASAQPRLYRAQDVRIGTPVERLVRLVSLPSGDWADKLRDRLRQLTLRPLPNVLRPREAGVSHDGRWAWIVTDPQASTLATGDFVLGTGLPEADVFALLRQILRGLAALHAAGLSHGGVYPANIVCDPADGPERQVWLSGVELGPLAWWSGGNLLRVGSCLYHPPEWNGRTGEPSAAADLYAVGLIACHLLLGRDGAPDVFSAEARATDVRAEVGRALTQCKRSASARFRRLVIDQLLEPSPSQRTKVARQVLESLDTEHRSSRPSVPTMLTMAAMAVLCVIPLLVHRRVSQLETHLASLDRLAADHVDRLDKAGENIDSIRASHGTLNDRVQGVTTSLHATDVRLSEMATDVKAVMKKLNVNTSPAQPTPEEKAKAEWQNAFDWAEVRDGHLTRVLKAAEAVPDAMVKAVLKRWARSVQRESARAAPWFTADPLVTDTPAGKLPMLAAEFLAAARVPEDSDTKERNEWQQFERRLKSLGTAAATWKNWAAQDALTWQEVLNKIDLWPEREEKDVLQKWQTELERFQPNLRLVSGAAPAGYGVTRQVQLRTDLSDLSGPVHDWSAPTSHTYTGPPANSQEDPNACDLAFAWTPGNGVAVALWGERTTWKAGRRKHLLQQEFTGPIALWRAADQGQVAADGFVLQFEIVGTDRNEPCPGPPIARGVKQAAARLLK